MKSIFILIILVIDLRLFSQTIITTDKQNDVWLDSLKSSNLDNQIKMIRLRLLDDTAVYIPQVIPISPLRDRIIYIPQVFVADFKIQNYKSDSFKINGYEGESRLLITFRHQKRNHNYDFIDLKRDTTTKISTIKEINNFMSTGIISGVEIIGGDERSKILCGSFYFGIIFIDIIKSKDMKAIKSILSK